MELQGRHIIPLPRPQVWAALNDADVLRACIPGCQALTKTARMVSPRRSSRKSARSRLVFIGEVQLLDIVPGRSYTISGSGKGGVAGFAKGRSEVVLADGPEGTILSYTATAEIGGTWRQPPGRAGRSAGGLSSGAAGLSTPGAGANLRLAVDPGGRRLADCGVPRRPPDSLTDRYFSLGA
jgi:hypothetical protein